MSPDAEEIPTLHEHPGSTPTEPMVVDNHLVLPGTQPIDIGEGQTAPLSLLLSCRNPHCRYCTEGWVRRIEAGKPVTKVCACCVDRYRKRLAAMAREAKAAATITVAPLPSAAEEERAKRRVDRLSREVAVLEEEMAARGGKYVDRTADVAAAYLRHQAEEAEHADALAAVRAEIAEVQTRMGQLQTILEGAVVTARRLEQAHALAEAAAADCQRELEARRTEFEASVRGLRRELDRAQRRLARARGYNGLVVDDAGEARG
jgi:hypothetical protein